MAQIWKVRLPDGRVLTPGDWTSAVPLFSTIELGSAAFTVQSAFSYGVGADVPGSFGPRQSNDADTNLQGEGARLPENEELIVYNLAIEVFKIGTANPSTGADSIPATDAPDVEALNMLRLQRDLLVKFIIAAVKEYTHAPMGYFPASTGVQFYTSAAVSVVSAGTAGWVAGNNGGTDVQDIRTFASPLYVAGGETLKVDITAGPGSVQQLDLSTNSRMRLRVYLDGYRRRPVA